MKFYIFLLSIINRCGIESYPFLSCVYFYCQSSPSDLVIQVVLIAESAHLQSLLATYGIQTQTPHQIEPIEIWPPGELAKAYEQLGVNKKLGLTGRPPRPIGGLGTAKVHIILIRNLICCKIFMYCTLGQKKLIISFLGTASLHFHMPHLSFYSVN